MVDVEENVTSDLLKGNHDDIGEYFSVGKTMIDVSFGTSIVGSRLDGDESGSNGALLVDQKKYTKLGQSFPEVA